MSPDPLESGRPQVALALDVPDRGTALALLDRLGPEPRIYKVGLELFAAEGPALVREVLQRGHRVFLDLKLHDIPNTMRGAIRGTRRLPSVRFVTVHAGSGRDHLAACVDEAGGALGILAVTVLTSQDEAATREAGHTRAPAELVELRAASAQAAGCAGVVCSGHELARVTAIAPSLAAVVPGVRPAASDVGDQRRVVTPAQAIAGGARYLVVGRPILQAADPAAAADAIVAEIAAASARG